MVKTIDKVLLGVLMIFLVGMNAVFITALSSDNQQESIKTSGHLIVKDKASSESNLADSQDSQEDNQEKEVPITGNALERASTVALAYIGEGRVTDSEIGDEEGYYEIEITLENGNEVDVHLDESFNVLSAEWESQEDKD